MVFHWSLNGTKSLRVSKNLLSILTNLSNTVVWIVSACLLISKSSSPSYRPLEIVLSAHITIGITVIIIIITFLSVSPSLSQKSTWEQISIGLQRSSWYVCRFKLWEEVDGIKTSTRIIKKVYRLFFLYGHFYWDYTHETLVPFEVIFSGCNAFVVLL